MKFKDLQARLKYNPLAHRHPKKKKGVALILAVTSLMFMVFIASEVSKDSLIEFSVNSQEMNRLKAYYAAKSSLDIALLRVKLFQQANRLQLPAGFSQQLDQIWKFPFAWPIPITSEVNAVDRDSIKKLMKESFMDASYTHTIEDEGSKIDINDLVSPSKVLQEVTRKQILNIYNQKLEKDEVFRKEYQNMQFEDLVNRMTDFMSDKNSSVSGGDKRQFFSNLGPEYPPNRGFRTVDEIRLVPGMTDELFQLILPAITIYGTKAINPNTASKEVLKSLDAGITEEALQEALARRDNPEKGGPFTGRSSEECNNSLGTFLQQHGARLSDDFKKIPMICDKIYNFRIKATGVVGSGTNSVIKDITVVVMDINKVAQTLKSFTDKEKQQTSGNPNNPNKQATSPAGPPSDSLPKGPPRIVYWTEN